MQTFKNIILSATLLSGLLSTATAAPTASQYDVNVTETVQTRDDAICVGEYGVLGNTWTMTIPGDDRFDQTCGGGILDNARGRCGVITEWECNYISGKDAEINFKTTIGCHISDMNDVLATATNNVYAGLCGGNA